jgi:hypothetical protein
MGPQDLSSRFRFYPALTEERKAEHERVRAACMGLALELGELLPAGREYALAMTKLEEVMFWANAAVARQDATS